MVRSLEKHLPLLRQIKAALRQGYGGRLADVIVFGSYVRGEAHKDSDVDLAVVLRGDVNRLAEIDRIHDLIYDLELQSTELISVYPISEEELGDTEWPLHAHIRQEGVVV